MNCSSASCDNDVWAWCQWGSKSMPSQQGNLCEIHAMQLWEMLNPLLQLGEAWYRIDRPQDTNGEKQ